MGCVVEGTEDLAYRFKFNNQHFKQSILIDMILRYEEKTINDLASAMDITADKLIDVYKGRDFLSESEADDLAQVFLVFFGNKICSKFSVRRSYDYLT